MADRLLEPELTPGVAYTELGSAIRWLTEILGLRVARAWGSDDDPMFAYLWWRNSIVSVSKRPDDDSWATGPVGIGLLADEDTVRRTYERASVAGCDFVRPLETSSNPAVPDGYLGFTVRDAEANLWSMYSRGPRFEIT